MHDGQSQVNFCMLYLVNIHMPVTENCPTVFRGMGRMPVERNVSIISRSNQNV